MHATVVRVNRRPCKKCGAVGKGVCGGVVAQAFLCLVPVSRLKGCVGKCASMMPVVIKVMHETISCSWLAKNCIYENKIK